MMQNAVSDAALWAPIHTDIKIRHWHVLYACKRTVPLLWQNMLFFFFGILVFQLCKWMVEADVSAWAFFFFIYVSSLDIHRTIWHAEKFIGVSLTQKIAWDPSHSVTCNERDGLSANGLKCFEHDVVVLSWTWAQGISVMTEAFTPGLPQILCACLSHYILCCIDHLNPPTFITATVRAVQQKWTCETKPVYLSQCALLQRKSVNIDLLFTASVLTWESM